MSRNLCGKVSLVSHGGTGVFEVDDPKAAFKKFENLACRLLAVPNSELTEKMVDYERGKHPRKRPAQKPPAHG